jgi:hypothetical protein
MEFMFVEILLFTIKSFFMALHEFKFNQRELEALVRLTQTNNISVSICGLPGYGGDRTMYLCGLSHTIINGVEEMNTNIRPIAACPFPPVWRDDLPVINHADLRTAPKFIFSAQAVSTLLSSNAHAPGGEKLVTVSLDAGIKTNGELESFVTFTMKDAAGNPVAGATLEGRTM